MPAPHPPEGNVGQAPAPESQPGPGKGLAGGQRQAGSGPTHSLPLPVPALLHWAPPSSRACPPSPSSQAPWKTRKQRKLRLGSLQGTVPSPGINTWLGGGCPVLALPRVRRGSWSWGELLRTRTGGSLYVKTQIQVSPRSLRCNAHVLAWPRAGRVNVCCPGPGGCRWRQ